MPIILATWEAEIRRIMVQVQSRQKDRVTSIPMEKKLGMAVHTCHPSNCGKCNVKDCSEFSLSKKKKCDPTSKITQAKRARGMAQVVEHLPNK
jgi:ArsR family metal-binding transcriptional regulator